MTGLPGAEAAHSRWSRRRGYPAGCCPPAHAPRVPAPAGSRAPPCKVTPPHPRAWVPVENSQPSGCGRRQTSPLALTFPPRRRGRCSTPRLLEGNTAAQSGQGGPPAALGLLTAGASRTCCPGSAPPPSSHPVCKCFPRTVPPCAQLFEAFSCNDSQGGTRSRPHPEPVFSHTKSKQHRRWGGGQREPRGGCCE